MKRFIYSIPVAFLLIPWLFFSIVVFATGIYAWPLFIPVAATLLVAFMVHRDLSKSGRHFLAALAACAVLGSPSALVVAAFCKYGSHVIDTSSIERDVTNQLNAMGISAVNGRELNNQPNVVCDLQF